jgi:hypothetical protein
MKHTAPDSAPPRWADWLLARFCRGELYEEIRGDLLEDFADRLAAQGSFRAGLWYGLEVVFFMRPHVLRRRSD